jgi:hypothetical protein
LLASTTLKPWPIAVRSRSPVSSLVTSTMIGRDTACAAIVVSASAALALRPPSDAISAPPSFF